MSMVQSLQQLNNTCIAIFESEISKLIPVANRVGIDKFKSLLLGKYGIDVPANRIRLQLKSLGYVVKGKSLKDNGYIEISKQIAEQTK